MNAVNNVGRQIVFFCTFLTVCGGALADSILPPSSYTVTDSSGRYVFVMLLPIPATQEIKDATHSEAEIKAIRQKYAQCGLYRNDGSTVPLWTVNWYSHGGVTIASDGVHVIRHGDWGSSVDDPAFSFYANGQWLRTYRIRDLVDFEWLLGRTGGGRIIWWDAAALDDTNLRYTLSTKDGNHFVFDLKTGQIVSESRPGRKWVRIAGVLIVLVLIAVVGWWIVKRAKNSGQTRCSAAQPG